MFYPASTVFEKMNAHGATKTPFLFAIDFQKEEGFFCRWEEASKEGIWYNGNRPSPGQKKSLEISTIHLQKNPVSFSIYENAFRSVQEAIHAGRSYLVNLTFPTPISLNLPLEEVFFRSEAKYKVLVPGHFLFFSPETFVQIRGNSIASFPMKGTIDASIENAASIILEDPKEMAEHATITDLIRNDLSMVSQNVQVEKYRYLDKIETNGKNLLQVSSKITGELPSDWPSRIGGLMERLLPAGSICGAPKLSTLQIIRHAEISPRGFYTGVFGSFDGRDLDSSVMIRYIEVSQDRLIFHSGGGITAQSDPKKEYQEMIDKIYVPIH